MFKGISVTRLTALNVSVSESQKNSYKVALFLLYVFTLSIADVEQEALSISDMWDIDWYYTGCQWEALHLNQF